MKLYRVETVEDNGHFIEAVFQEVSPKEALIWALTEPCHVGLDLICSAHQWHPLPGRAWTEIAEQCDDMVKLGKFIEDVARGETKT